MNVRSNTSTTAAALLIFLAFASFTLSFGENYLVRTPNSFGRERRPATSADPTRPIRVRTSSVSAPNNFPSSDAHHSRPRLEECSPIGYLTGTDSNCNTEHESQCCKAGDTYPQYYCSPPVAGETIATMTINSFAEGGDGGGASKCDGEYHGDDELVVALSTGWYNYGSRCSKTIRINGNGNSVLAEVVDECDSINGCDADHDFQPPCHNNIVDASPAVWNALGMSGDDVGEYQITWSDA